MSELFEDQRLVLRDCVEKFDRLGLAYMLTGSMAMAAYAMMRMTNDIDIVIQVDSSDAQHIIDTFEPDYYVPRGRVSDAISRKRMFNLLHHATIVKVDCVIRNDDAFQNTAFGRRERKDFAGIDLWVITKEDLIVSKMIWAKDTRSEMQIRDVAGILRNGYEESYVKGWVKKLALDDIFEECEAYLEKNYADRHES